MFSKIYNMKNLSDYLGISYEELKKVLFSSSNYVTYEIPKKHGGVRKISSPKKILKSIQYKLKSDFETKYHANNCVNGFVKAKSIYTNALSHEGKKYLLNIDLSDFFPTINFNRVRSLLKHEPFNANSEISRMLANLLTNGGLPQGAPTSPIISNMICRRMDSRLSKYCKKYNAIYTRYADDISISWNEVTYGKYYYDEVTKKPNDLILKIIEEEGFVVNDKKTFYSSRNGHKEVTGIIVNEYVNTPKDYFYRLRSIINDAIKNTFEVAYKHHCEKKGIEYKEENTKYFIQQVMGMMSYYKMIVNNEEFSRGRYINVAEKFNKLLGYNFCKINYNIEQLKVSGVYVFEKFDGDCILGYGTIFRYDKYLITCKHCLMTDEEFESLRISNCKEVVDYLSMYKYYYSDGINRFELNKVYISSKNDLAIFIDDNYAGKVCFNAFNCNAKQGDKITVLGYPDYKWLDGCSLIPGSVTSTRVIPSNGVGTDRNDYLVVNASIVSGNSGGPVVDEKGQVIGVATWGVEPNEAKYAMIKNGVLKASYIKEEIEFIEEIDYFN